MKSTPPAAIIIAEQPNTAMSRQIPKDGGSAPDLNGRRSEVGLSWCRMTWKFRLAYATVVGESMWLEMSLASEAGTITQTLPMHWVDHDHWEIEVGVETKGHLVLDYGYLMRGNLGERREWGGGGRSWNASESPPGKIFFHDEWITAGSIDRVYESKVFQVVGSSDPIRRPDPEGKGNHQFSLHMATLPEGLIPCVIGGIDALGDWEYAGAIPMIGGDGSRWTAMLDLPSDHRIEYKYALYDPREGRAARLEDGGNRVLEANRADMDFVRIHDEQFRRPADLKFRGTGIAVPVFSLRGGNGCGTGEFADLRELADWAATAGLQMIQILPINDTTSTKKWTDSYPYSAISVFALHPLYLRLDGMSYPVADVTAFETRRSVLNTSQQLDYESVMDFKWRICREVFDTNKVKILADKGFRSFLDENWSWVLDYGVFSAKRDEFGTADFSQWGDWSVYDSEKAEVFAGTDEVMFYTWLQYELDLQLRATVAYLHTKGIALKGDLPIGVDRNSTDAWVRPDLFKMDSQSGAPPDAFAVKGQNWGFPTYDWDRMALDGYQWWKSRFKKLSRYFDAYRIDHILGFFRIWQIPTQHIEGIMGWFDPALPIRSEEFEWRGIHFDYDRFCKPFIRDHVLHERFGDFADGIRRDFMMDLGEGRYVLKDDFSTQTGIRDFFEILSPGDWMNQEWIRDSLIGLVSEVLLFEVPGSGGTAFHPRMSMMDTESFRCLEEEARWRMKELYLDYFYQRQERFWKETALRKLPAMRAASEMLLCGEDLGMVPACVPGVMSDLGILSLEIQRWPKSGDLEFFHPKNAPYLSVIATGTHDMSTLRGWWREDPHLRARFAWEMFGIGFPEEDLSTGMARRIIEQHLHSPAMWAIFPIQDLLAMDEGLRDPEIAGERINVPAVPDFYWRWRMKTPISELGASGDFTGMLSEMISKAHR